MGSTCSSDKRRGLCAALIAAAVASAGFAHSAMAQSDLVPRGWTHDTAASNRRTIHFTSPDGHATLTMRDVDTSATPSPAALVQPAAGEQATYRQRGRDWWVVSGYRGDAIFYRRANFACGHRRIHVIDLTYPRAQKRQFDALVTSMSHRLERFRDVCPKR